MHSKRGFPWYTGPIVGPIVVVLAGGKYAAKGNDIEWDKFFGLVIIGVLAEVILELETYCLQLQDRIRLKYHSVRDNECGTDLESLYSFCSGLVL